MPPRYRSHHRFWPTCRGCPDGQAIRHTNKTVRGYKTLHTTMCGSQLDDNRFSPVSSFVLSSAPNNGMNPTRRFAPQPSCAQSQCGFRFQCVFSSTAALSGLCQPLGRHEPCSSAAKPTVSLLSPSILGRPTKRAALIAGRLCFWLTAQLQLSQGPPIENEPPAPYFPTQNSLKMVSRRSSVIISPVISPKAFTADVRSMATKSAGIPSA